MRTAGVRNDAGQVGEFPDAVAARGRTPSDHGTNREILAHDRKWRDLFV
jgi:hypothetical protein